MRIFPILVLKFGNKIIGDPARNSIPDKVITWLFETKIMIVALNLVPIGAALSPYDMQKETTCPRIEVGKNPHVKVSHISSTINQNGDLDVNVTNMSQNDVIFLERLKLLFDCTRTRCWGRVTLSKLPISSVVTIPR